VLGSLPATTFRSGVKLRKGGNMVQVERLYPNRKIRVLAPGLQSRLFEPEDIDGAMEEAERLARLFDLEISVCI